MGVASSNTTTEKIRLLKLQEKYLQKITCLQQDMVQRKAASPSRNLTRETNITPAERNKATTGRRKSLLEISNSTKPLLNSTVFLEVERKVGERNSESSNKVQKTHKEEEVVSQEGRVSKNDNKIMLPSKVDMEQAFELQV